MADGLGVDELSLALEAASNAYRELRTKARQAGSQAQAARFQKAADEAFKLQQRARYRLQKGLVNPTGEKVRQLKDATKALNDRLEELRQAQADFEGIAQAFSILTDAIKLFGLI